MAPKHSKSDEVILAKLEGLEALQNEKFTNIEKMFDQSFKEHENFQKRINILELWQANSLGKLAIISVAIGVAITLLTSWLSSKL